MRNRRLSSMTRAPCRKVTGVRGLCRGISGSEDEDRFARQGQIARDRHYVEAFADRFLWLAIEQGPEDRLAGSRAAISWPGSVSPLSRRSRNECSSAPLCPMSRWRAPVTCSEGHPNRDRRLPVDVAQGRLPYAMPVAASFPDAPRRLPWCPYRKPKPADSDCESADTRSR